MEWWWFMYAANTLTQRRFWSGPCLERRLPACEPYVRFHEFYDARKVRLKKRDGQRSGRINQNAFAFFFFFAKLCWQPETSATKPQIEAKLWPFLSTRKFWNASLQSDDFHGEKTLGTKELSNLVEDSLQNGIKWLQGMVGQIWVVILRENSIWSFKNTFNHLNSLNWDAFLNFVSLSEMVSIVYCSMGKNSIGFCFPWSTWSL